MTSLPLSAKREIRPVEAALFMLATCAIFHKAPAPEVWIGALTVFAAGSCISYPEARLARQAEAAAMGEVAAP